MVERWLNRCSFGTEETFLQEILSGKLYHLILIRNSYEKIIIRLIQAFILINQKEGFHKTINVLLS